MNERMNSTYRNNYWSHALSAGPSKCSEGEPSIVMVGNGSFRYHDVGRCSTGPRSELARRSRTIFSRTACSSLTDQSNKYFETMIGLLCNFHRAQMLFINIRICSVWLSRRRKGVEQIN